MVASYLAVTSQTLALVGIAAFLGHLYPVFFHFKGGKGVATMLGVLFGFSWMVGLATAATWLFVAKGLKISSLSALIATLLAPFYVWWLAPSQPLVVITAIMTAILYWRHRNNIQNLLSGKESKIGKSR
jgi:glycerol-3-phosphate acyltransferase PlsY